MLAAIYYFLVMDRVDEALDLFNELDPDNARQVSAFNYDYLQAYLAFYTGRMDDVKIANELATEYKNMALPPSKKQLWEEVYAQLAEIKDMRQDNGDFTEPYEDKPTTLDVAIQERTVRIDTCKITEVMVNFYRLDLELHFSTAPFQTLEYSYNFVTPNESRSKEIKVTTEQLRLVIPQTQHLDDANLIVEVIGRRADGKKNIVKAQTVYDNDLEVQVGKSVGQIRVMKKTERDGQGGGAVTPISKGYVKVYGRVKGTTKGVFYKDGYTDLRGRFDFRTISTDLVEDIDKFAILVCTESAGQTVLEIDA